MNISEIEKLSALNVEAICNSEEDVKMKFIVPLLKALGHEEMFFESDHMDIVIRGAQYKTTMLVEAKHHTKPLADHVQQLNNYWNKHRTTVAILCNGREVWIFHPAWTEKQFKDTLLFSVKRQDLVSQKEVLFRLMSAESMQKGETRDYLQKYEKEIEDQEEKINSLRKEKALHLSGITALNDKIRIIDNEMRQIERRQPLNIYGAPSATVSTTARIVSQSNRTNDTKTYIAALNAANYYGLVLARQSMFCINYDRMTKTSNYVLYNMPSESQHGLSSTGNKFLQEIKRTHLAYPCYYAEATYIKLTRNDLEMWNKLCDERQDLFPFWDAEGGPWKFNNNKSGEPEPKYIALCRIYGLNAPTIGKSDISRTMHTIRQITNEQKADEITNALKSKVLIADAHYDARSQRIIEIVKEYDAGYVY